MTGNAEIKVINAAPWISTMKILLSLAAILVISEAAFPPYASLFRAIQGVSSGVSSVDFPSYKDQCKSGNARECISCSEAKVCLPDGRPIAKVNCSSYNPAKPFCNLEDGQCTDIEPSKCRATAEHAFQCPSQDGTYPDPADCAAFHYCSNGKDITLVCPTKNVYDHSLGTCKLQRRVADCVKFNCLHKEGEDVVYPKDDRIWATCAGGNAYIMGRCKDYEGYDVGEQKCTRVCRAVENQPIDDVCDKYIRCAEIGNGKLEPVTFPCPPGQGFDKDTKLCSTKISCSSSSGSEENNSNDENSSGNPDDETTEVNDDEENSENPGPARQASISSRINSSGGNNSNNNVSNGNDEANGNLVNGNNNDNNSNNGNVGSGNQNRPSSRIINNSGSNNANNNVANGDDNVNGNLVNGNNNEYNQNSGNVKSESQGRSLFSRINNSGNDNAHNNVENGDDNTNGNLVNGNDNSGNSNVGNVGSGNTAGPFSRINNSGNNNADNNVENGDDNTNGNIVNGNGNSGNSNSGNVGSLNQNRLDSRIINNSGNSNNDNTITNGDDDVNGTLVNGNNNANNINSGNVESGNRDSLSSRIINNSGNSNNNQTVINGNDNTNGDIINGNNNNNNANSNNVDSADVHGNDEEPTPAAQDPELLPNEEDIVPEVTD